MAFVFSWFFLKSYLGILSGNKPGFYDKAVNKDFLNLSNCAAKMGDNDDGKNIEQKQWTINQLENYHTKHSGRNNATRIYTIWYNIKLGSKLMRLEVISFSRITVNIRIFNAIAY